MDEFPETTGGSRNPDGTFKKGVSGNPEGRPKGSLSIKDLVRQHLEDNPEDLKEFVAHFVKENRQLAWQMLEGRPFQASDITSKGNEIKGVPIYGGQSVQDKGHEGDTKDIQPQEAN